MTPIGILAVPETLVNDSERPDKGHQDGNTVIIYIVKIINLHVFWNE